MSNPRDKEYFKRQSNIYALLFEAYLDKAFLDSVEMYKEEIPTEITEEIKDATFVLSHICELAKRDMALSLWKIYYDDSDDANTLKRLNRYLYSNYRVRYKIVETDNIKNARSILKKARNGFIAHNLMDDTGRVLQIADLFAAMQDIRCIFNDLCFKEVDSRAKELTDFDISSIVFCEKKGFNPMIMSALTQNQNEGDEKDA